MILEQVEAFTDSSIILDHDSLRLIGLSCQPQLNILQFALSVILALDAIVIECFCSGIMILTFYPTLPLKIYNSPTRLNFPKSYQCTDTLGFSLGGLWH